MFWIHAAGADVKARHVSPEGGDLRAGCIDEEFGEIIGAEIVHEIFGDDGDGGCDVLQVGPQSGAGERAVRPVASVLFRQDFEGRQLDGLALRWGGGLSADGGRSGEPAGNGSEEGKGGFFHKKCGWLKGWLDGFVGDRRVGT